MRRSLHQSNSNIRYSRRTRRSIATERVVSPIRRPSEPSSCRVKLLHLVSEHAVTIGIADAALYVRTWRCGKEKARGLST